MSTFVWVYSLENTDKTLMKEPMLIPVFAIKKISIRIGLQLMIAVIIDLPVAFSNNQWIMWLIICFKIHITFSQVSFSQCLFGPKHKDIWFPIIEDKKQQMFILRSWNQWILSFFALKNLILIYYQDCFRLILISTPATTESGPHL